MIRILVADDFEAWRVLVRRELQPQSDWQIVGEALDGLEAVRETIELRPDLVLLDISMPQVSGLDACPKLLESLPEVKVISLSVNNHNEVMSAALAMGAEEYVLKENAGRELIAVSRSFTRRPFVPELRQFCVGKPKFRKTTLRADQTEGNTKTLRLAKSSSPGK